MSISPPEDAHAYCIRFIEVLNLPCYSENYYSLLSMLNLMYNLEIRKPTVLCAFFEISLRPFDFK